MPIERTYRVYVCIYHNMQRVAQNLNVFGRVRLHNVRHQSATHTVQADTAPLGSFL